MPEEAAVAGGDEDREKEILMERIQSIKEEKQVSLRLLSALSHAVRPASSGLSAAGGLAIRTGWAPSRHAAPAPRDPAFREHSLGLCLNPVLDCRDGSSNQRVGPRLCLEVGLSLGD